MEDTQGIASFTREAAKQASTCISLVRPRRDERLINLPARPVDVQVDLANSALVLVDMQNDFCHRDGWFARTGSDVEYANEIVPILERLLASARAYGLPVIHLHWGVRADCLDMSPGHLAFSGRFGQRTGYGEIPPGGVSPALVEGSWGAQSIDALWPKEDDIVVLKNRFSGFWNNALDAVLHRLEVSTLFFAGINTERCVMATLQDATFLGYDAVLVEDSVATPSPRHIEEAALTLIRQIYGFTTTSKDFCRS